MWYTPWSNACIGTILAVSATSCQTLHKDNDQIDHLACDLINEEINIAKPLTPKSKKVRPSKQEKSPAGQTGESSNG